MAFVTDDRWFERERQVRRTQALADMLVAANEAEIPPMRWTVNAAAGSSLYGEIDTPLDRHPQTTFDAWVKFLGLDVNRAGDRAAGTLPAHHDIPVGIHNPDHH